ncbi:MAG: glycosyltransferase [Acidobacteria bacterium]|nr:MAG: glycosyltransferase [Acidobacteriota bacterium]
MRIALFAERDLSAPGGLTTTIAGLLDHVPHDIHIVPYLNPPQPSSLLRVNEVARRLREHRIELVHIAAAGPLAFTALYVAARLRLPIVGSFDIDFLTATALRRRYLRSLLRLCDKVLVSSACARSTIEDVAAPETLVVWRPGVDIETFAPSKRSESLREKWHVSKSRVAVVYAGTLSEGHGANRLLALELALRRLHPMHRLIVAGDGPALPELRYRCSEAVFLGNVPGGQMPEVIASADLLVSPSERQSTYHAVLEAQACGLPVVVMARGAARERAADAAAVVCRSDVDFIVDTAALIRTDARRSTMGHAAREFAMHQQWESGLAPIFAQYRSAADASGPARRRLEGIVPARY